MTAAPIMAASAVSKIGLKRIAPASSNTSMRARSPVRALIASAALAQNISYPTTRKTDQVDTYHGVCHAHFLENVAALDQAHRDRGRAGRCSLFRSVRWWLGACAGRIALPRNGLDLLGAHGHLHRAFHQHLQLTAAAAVGPQEGFGILEVAVIVGSRG